MIKKIESLRNFGIFRNFNGSNTQTFGKYNLIYGWNGSGKSTLALVFESLERRDYVASQRFPDSEFKVRVENSIDFTQENVTACRLNIRTFNTSFIKENIDWNSHTNSILMVTKEKIDERKKLVALEELQMKENEDLRLMEVELEVQKKQVSKVLTDSAKNIKLSLKMIDTSENRFLNYDKSKLESFLSKNELKVKNTSSILSEEELISLTMAAKPEKKGTITFNFSKLSHSDLSTDREKVLGLISKTIVGTSIDRLANNPKIQSWVQEGLTVHEHLDNAKCEFCGNIVSNKRLKDLEAHFSAEYQQSMRELADAIQKIAECKINFPDMPVNEDFYPELSVKLKAAKLSLESATKCINDIFDDWITQLTNKKSDPFSTNFEIKVITNAEVENFNSALSELLAIIESHNVKTLEFEASLSTIKEKVELHYAAESAAQSSYFEKVSKISTIDKAINDRQLVIASRTTELYALRASLINEELGASKMNNALHRFLGREDINLVFNRDKLGYEIHRRGSAQHSKDLSEGEMTAIAFVLFVLKLDENNNQLGNTIVVIDDPVSSFDSNHLFHAYAFLREHCDKVKQLFVLTHNFTFFRRVCDWFTGVNNSRASRDPKKMPNAFFFVLESSSSESRSSKLLNAPEDLIKYHSEYHYLFSRLYAFLNKVSISVEESYITANLGRRILESFLSFKFPKYRSDFAQLLNQAQKACEDITSAEMEKLKRFTDRYSHSNVLEIDSESIGNLAGEAPLVIGTIFKIIQKLDIHHYNEMKDIVASRESQEASFQLAV